MPDPPLLLGAGDPVSETPKADGASKADASAEGEVAASPSENRDEPRALLGPGSASVSQGSEDAAQPSHSDESQTFPKTELGRVVDRNALDTAEGARGLLRLELPPAWLARSGTLEVDAPERLVCARCEGGGCASCGNSGALKVDADPRTFSVSISSGITNAQRLRIERPFGDTSTIQQLWVDLVPREGAAPKTARWSPDPEQQTSLARAHRSDLAHPPSAPPIGLVIAALVAALAVALAVALSSR